MDRRAAAAGLASGRALVGSIFLLAPRRAVRAWTGAEATRPALMAARGLGGRDLALGLATLGGLAGRDGSARRWLEAGAIADGADFVATLSARGDVAGYRRVLWLATSGAATVLGLWLAGQQE